MTGSAGIGGGGGGQGRGVAEGMIARTARTGLATCWAGVQSLDSIRILMVQTPIGAHTQLTDLLPSSFPGGAGTDIPLHAWAQGRWDND